MAEQITSPVGRLVFGSLYDAVTKDYDGNPLVVKSGPDAGKPRVDYRFGLAIPKGSEQHWNQTPWGQIIWRVGATAFPNQHQRPDFAWKIFDGDSTVPNRRGNKPCDNEDFRGNWILTFSSGFAPKVCNADGSAYLTEPGHVKTGYYVQVFFEVDGNGNPNNPGVYLNHRIVSFQAFGKEILTGIDPKQAGFGNAPLPAGASAAPIAGIATTTPPPATPPAAPVSVTPHPGILTPPVTPPAPPAAPARQMTPKAAGQTYEAYIAAGWTDALLIEHGLMVG